MVYSVAIDNWDSPPKEPTHDQLLKSLNGLYMVSQVGGNRAGQNPSIRTNESKVLYTTPYYPLVLFNNN